MSKEFKVHLLYNHFELGRKGGGEAIPVTVEYMMGDYYWSLDREQ